MLHTVPVIGFNPRNVQHSRCPNTLKLSEVLDLKDFHWAHIIIKVKQHLVDFRWKIEFDAKTGHRIHMTISMRRTDNVTNS